MEVIHPSKPAWKGPYEDGITQSILSRFRTCPFQFYLYAYCGLEESKTLEPNLIWGDILHKGLELYIKGESLNASIAGMLKYQDERYPTAPASFQYTTRNMLSIYNLDKLASWNGIQTEVDLRTNHTHHSLQFVPISYNSVPPSYTPPNLENKIITEPFFIHLFRDVKIRGKIDMLSNDQTKMGDHKGKGKHAPSIDALREEINQDFQMNFYAYFLDNIEHWYYDIFRIPEAIPRVPPQRVSETPEQWANRIFFTHSDMMNNLPISKCPGMWAYQINHFQPVESNIEYFNKTIAPSIDKLILWWEYVNHPKFDPNDPLFFNHLFYISPVRDFNPTTTYSFKCKYHNFLIGKESFENLSPVKSFYPELEEKVEQ